MSHSKKPEHEPEPESEEFLERDDAVIGKALRWSLVVFVVVGGAIGGAVYWMTRPEPVPDVVEKKLALPEVRDLPTLEIPELPFTDVTEEAGIGFVHENGAAGEKLLPETMGGGCAFFDYDNDGDQDLLLTNGRRWDRAAGSSSNTDAAADAAKLTLYRNDGSGHFEDVSAGSGLDVSAYGMGVAVGDYDNDGHVDVFLSALGSNYLFHNEGAKFVDVTQSAGVAGGENEWGTSTGWFDYDNDGDLDLFVCNYVGWTRDFDLSQQFQLIGGGRAYGRPQAFTGTYPYLYRNDGEGKFTDVSAEAGVQVKNRATGVPLAKSLGVAFADFDDDGWMDVVVANDTVQNLLFHNQGNGTFQETAALTGVAFDVQGNARGAMGIDTGHFRNSDALGIAIGNFSNEMTALYVSRGKAVQFNDEAVSTGLGPNTRLELTFGVFFVDCDLDGRLDLFASNGHLEEDINKVQSSQFYEQPPQLFWNCGPEHPTEFMPVPAEKCGEDFSRRIVGRGATYADIDGDGDLDIFIASSGRRPRLLRNDQQSGHHWLRLKLVGRYSNTDAIGARVDVHVADKVLSRYVMPTRSYLSQSELPVTFGLGNSDQIEKVVIRWPDRTQQEIGGLEIDRLHTIEQSPKDTSAGQTVP